MKTKCKIQTKILFILIICTIYNNLTFSQDKKISRVIDLPKECKLVIDTSIDLNDTISIEILKRIETILPKIQQLIPTDSVTIKLAISSIYILPNWGIGSRATGDDSGETVEINYDPKHPNFKVEYIFRSLVHELHHVGRMRNPEYELTLLECMVNEGLAEHFMVEVFNCELSPWDIALTDEQIQENIIRVKPLLQIKHESWTNEFSEKYFNPWMLGRDGDEPIPHWAGYSIGWKIVENYLIKHPEASASSLVWTEAKIIAISTPELLVDNE
jgi:hypothetical protein